MERGRRPSLRTRYVNGIGFDMMAGETPTTGQIAVVESTGEIRVVADDLAFPNGMAFDAEGRTLAVAESHASRITAYTVAESGDLTDRRVFAEVPRALRTGSALPPTAAFGTPRSPTATAAVWWKVARFSTRWNRIEAASRVYSLRTAIFTSPPPFGTTRLSRPGVACFYRRRTG